MAKESAENLGPIAFKFVYQVFRILGSVIIFENGKLMR